MKIMRLRQPASLDNIYLDDGPAAAAPGRGEIRVRLHASSLNYHDYAVAGGMLQTPEGRILLSDAGGEVLEVGEGVRGLKVGDTVASLFFPDWAGGEATPANIFAVPGDRVDGYARQEVTVPATAFTRAPTGYSFEEAATLPCAALTAWRALVVNGGLKAGDTVLVQGTGGVSIFALQFAKAAGCTVIATSSSDDKLARLKTMGADQVINYRQTPAWGALARELSGGRGVDHVVEIGGSGTLTESINACRLGGHIAMIGILAGMQGEVSTAAIMRKQIRLQGLSVGSREHQLDMIRAIETNGIRPVIDRSFPMEQLAEAFRYPLSGRHFGKIAITI
jgi:NADPH:quinone reductase-like Zn-dependent oxidoreductase